MTKRGPETKLRGSNRPQRKHEPEQRLCAINQQEQQKPAGPRSGPCDHPPLCEIHSTATTPHSELRQPGNQHDPGRKVHRPVPGTPANQQIAPDMMVSLDAAPALYYEDNDYIISRQGKPLPDATGNGPIFAQHILKASNKAGHHPPAFSLQNTA